MLIGDDDDYDAMLEEGDATMEEEEPPVVETMSSSDAGSIVGEDVSVDDISLADFALLPLVYGVVEAHRTKDTKAAEAKMVALRRAVRKAEGRWALLQQANSEETAEPEAAEALLRARTELLESTKKKLGEQ